MSTLAQQQAALFSLVTGDGKTKVKPGALVKGGALTPSARVDVYGHMYVLRTRDALRDDFPHVATLLGEDGFARAVEGYIAEHHSTHYSLARLGHSFAAHLENHPPKKCRADLSALAELEWARSEAFVAEDSPVVAPQAIAALGPAFAEATLDFVPSLRLLTLRHDVGPLWSSLEHGGEVPPPLKPRKTFVLVWRKGLEVFHAEVPKEEARALALAQKGKDVQTCCVAFAQLDEADQAAFKAIGSWVTEGMLARAG